MEIQTTTPENAKKYISSLQTKITYLQYCASRLENEILRYELKLINFEELQEGVEKTLENARKEIKEQLILLITILSALKYNLKLFWFQFVTETQLV
jgi:hypothetical protein